jgi:hypothetical protein
LYWGLYELLRRSGARSQSFIYVVVLLFALVAATQFHSAATKGGWNFWTGGLASVLYAAGFAWIAYRGSRHNRADVAAAYQARQEEQIHIQTQAILRARAIEEATRDHG